jgi:hypothetical protein
MKRWSPQSKKKVSGDIFVNCFKYVEMFFYKTLDKKSRIKEPPVN